MTTEHPWCVSTEQDFPGAAYYKVARSPFPDPEKGAADVATYGWAKAKTKTNAARAMYKDILADLRTLEYKLCILVMLWWRRAPIANIYRYCGMLRERQRHREDLLTQLDLLARDHPTAVAGADLPEERRAALLKALASKREALPGSAADIKGLLPVEELCRDPLGAGHRLDPSGSKAPLTFYRARALALGLFAAQLLAPTLVVLREWPSGGACFRHQEAMRACLLRSAALQRASGYWPWLASALGAAAMVVVLTNLLRYAKSEIEVAEKLGRLCPQDAFWPMLGSLTNMWCVVCALLATPAVFLSAGGIFEIASASVGVFAVFLFSDLVGMLGRRAGVDDDDFRRAIAWTYSLLAQCPADLRDVTRRNARRAEDLWCVHYDAAGALLCHDGVTRCTTRIAPKAKGERSSLLPGSRAGKLLASGRRGAVYRSGATTHGKELPTTGIRAQIAAWCLLAQLLWALRLASPLLWLASHWVLRRSATA